MSLHYSHQTLLNFGCGTVFHSNWTNYDAKPASHLVHRWDVSRGIPLGDGVADVCYCSHFLEHLTPDIANAFLVETLRVLRPGGVARFVVPDLEYNARLYLSSLEELASLTDREAWHRFKWATLNLFEQMVRDRPGGEMSRFWREANESTLRFIVNSTAGQEALGQRGHYGREKLPGAGIRRAMQLLLSPKRLFTSGFAKLRLTTTSALLGISRPQASVMVSGELHKYAYDRLSLGDLLQRIGFVDIRVVEPQSSRIEKWEVYSLDVDREGRVRKPNSLFMEGVKTNDIDQMSLGATASLVDRQHYCAGIQQ